MNLTLPGVMRECWERRIELSADADDLIVDAPSDLLTEELIEALRVHKPEILHYLRTGRIEVTNRMTVAEFREAFQFFALKAAGRTDD